MRESFSLMLLVGFERFERCNRAHRWYAISVSKAGCKSVALAVFVAFLFGGWYLEAHEPTVKKPMAKQGSVQPATATPGSESEAMPAGAHDHSQPVSPPAHSESEETTAPPHIHPEEGMPSHQHDGGEETSADHAHSHAAMAGAGDAHAAHSAHLHGASTPAAPLVLSLLLATLAIAAGLTLYARHSLLAKGTTVLENGRNLLDSPVVGKVLRSRQFLTFLIAPTMAVFTFIVLAGFLGEQNTGNPAVLLTWILWWPAVIFTFFILGRIWCAICPFGYLGDVAQKIFSFKWKVPSIFRNMWWRLGLFLALTWATTLWALDRWPNGTAWLALGETLGAIALAFFFEKRAFCRYLCPIGGVFGLYSMAAPVRVGVKDSKVCYRDCPEKNCYDSCAWFQYPPMVDRNAECSLCLDCVRACPHDNLTLQTQQFGADLVHFQSRRKSLDEALAIAIVMGVALLQTMVMLNGWADWQAKIGAFLHLEPGRLLYTVSFIAVGVIAPILVVSLVTYLSVSQKSSGEFSRVLRTYAYSFVPLGLALHAAHNFHHLFGEGSAMWTGLKTAFAKYAGRTIAEHGPEMTSAPGPNTLFVMQWVALLGGLYLAFRVGTALVRRDGLPPQRAFRSALPIVVFATAFTILNLVVLSAAMGHRH